MWKCKNCGEESEDSFDSCWKCGWSAEGNPPGHSEDQKPTGASSKPGRRTFEIPKWLIIVVVLGGVVAVQTLKVNQDMADRDLDSAPIPQGETPFVVTEKRLNELRDGLEEAGLHVSIIERRERGKYLVKIDSDEQPKDLPKDPRMEALVSDFRRKSQRSRSTLKLYQAVFAGDLRSVSNLIEEAKADLNGDPHFSPGVSRVSQTNEGNIGITVEYRTPLHLAVSRTNLDIAGLLVMKGANINARDQNGKTPLHLAAKDGSVKIVEMLLENQADPEIKDATGKTAREYATEAGQEEIVNLFGNAVSK